MKSHPIDHLGMFISFDRRVVPYGRLATDVILPQAEPGREMAGTVQGGS